jgi:L-alanine-DL-glutamate epimerase-like enolase superfamily enzyme
MRAANGLVDGFGMKISRMGGLAPMATFRDLCEARHLPHTSDDAWGGDIIAAACTQLGATVNPKLFEGTWIAQPYIAGHYDPTGGITVVDGHIKLPEGPGLGLNPDVAIFSKEVAHF